MKLFYNPDGANIQAQMTLVILRHKNIEPAYSWDWHNYDYGDVFNDGPQFSRWENYREQGYVIHWLLNGKQINIAFFEHRNSDSLCAVRWEQLTLNSPTIDTMPDDLPFYQSKWDVSYQVDYGEYEKMADWIIKELTEFWVKNKKK